MTVLHQSSKFGDSRAEILSIFKLKKREESMEGGRTAPPGIRLARAIGGKNFKVGKGLILVITFIAYACYHASRKPPSIVKSVLDPESISSDQHLTSLNTLSTSNSILKLIFIPRGKEPALKSSAAAEAGWAPFNGEDGKARLGQIDVAFLACYAFGMFFAGHLGDRVDLRLFLTLGMIGSGTFVCLFGLGYWWQIHSLYYFLLVQMLAGLFQATGWPSVVAIVGNWCGKSKRGLIMGIWNAHTSVGNIIGSVTAAGVLSLGWGWSFVLPGLLMMIGGLIVYMFLVVDPKDIGLPSPYEAPVIVVETEDTASDCSDAESSSSFHGRSDVESPAVESPAAATRAARSSSPTRDQPVGFLEAWMIPGVAPFAFCLFFSKLVAYTFLYWLPFYIRHTSIGGVTLSEKTAGNLSILFDVGGVVGGVLAGHISDRLSARAITAASFTYLSIPALFLYHELGSISMGMNVGLMMLLGMLVNGPYALITTAVSADLGTHSSLRGDARALATVTAIIDGCGSVGAAIGPLLTGYISQRGWDDVFYMLMAAALVAGLLLTRLVVAEAMEKIGSYRKAAASGGDLLQEPLLVNGKS